MAAPRRRYFWAVVSPSARHTVDYLESPFATLAAANVKSGEYLALVVEPERVPRFGLPLSKSAVAYLVQPASLEPLPETYLPIAPCRMGSRDPLDPQFLWPFEACVVNTGRILVFDPVGIQEAAVKTAHVLSQDVAEAFASIHCEDFDVQTLLNYQKRLADELVEQGVEDLTSEDTWWTTFSVKSTAAQLVPGEFFPPEDISAKIHFDIESLERLLPASQCFEDVREIKRHLISRFVHAFLIVGPDSERDSLAHRRRGRYVGL
ncbi:hypothetical protein FB451DRAFT_457767 [Mycena latifolia]|nr:hypothetical protein FB451DRAFT_457767 [Mycena latifolia]